MKSPELFSKVQKFKPSDGGPKTLISEVARRQKKLHEMIGIIKSTQKLCLGLQAFRRWIVREMEGPNEYEPFQIEIFKRVLEKFDAAPEFEVEEKT